VEFNLNKYNTLHRKILTIINLRYTLMPKSLPELAFLHYCKVIEKSYYNIIIMLSYNYLLKKTWMCPGSRKSCPTPSHRSSGSFRNH
jgi:hypothetical protein